jgi:hypothetical protein
MEGEREIRSVPSGLMCPISYDRMKDPVILIPSGNTYDCEQICKSLLYHPNLDPSSGVRYDRKLQYCDNLAVRQLVMETYGDKAFQKYDDSGFQTRYGKAWNSGNVGAAAAAVIQTRHREQARRERDRELARLDPLDYFLYFLMLLMLLLVYACYVVFHLIFFGTWSSSMFGEICLDGIRFRC